MSAYLVFKDLAIIIIFAKVFGILARKCKAPMVVGEIIAGLIIGPCLLGWVQPTDFILQMAEIGVILLMFSAGLETNLKEMIKTGPKALLIACAGVFVPLVGGALLYMCFYGFSALGTPEFFKAVFIGTIMTATSVGITVEALREMGYLKGKIGTTILNAAIIDDIIGMIVLTVVIGFNDPNSNPWMVVRNTVLFFCLALVGGYIAYKIFKKVDQRYPHTRRITIAGLALCLIMAYVAERYFGIADITGAYVAGIILCNIRDSEYIARRLDINSYVMFGPIFFASIGLKTNIQNMDWSILVFSLGFVAVALLTKIIGCGLMSMACKIPAKHAIKVGVGMMTRGEVALIVAQKGMTVGLLDPVYFTSVILLIITSSILTPILLKLLYSKYPESPEDAGEVAKV
ncbi:MAG: cation:proton antiporter [Lachnospiraceae bacterium]|nr:cation:proton antiporter [Lachnospiraceae bacterium]MBO5325786.1 cation:proton antiporter [Lachnospiraceae bacterium]